MKHPVELKLGSMEALVALHSAQRSSQVVAVGSMELPFPFLKCSAYMAFKENEVYDQMVSLYTQLNIINEFMYLPDEIFAKDSYISPQFIKNKETGETKEADLPSLANNQTIEMAVHDYKGQNFFSIGFLSEQTFLAMCDKSIIYSDKERKSLMHGINSYFSIINRSINSTIKDIMKNYDTCHDIKCVLPGFNIPKLKMRLNLDTDTYGEVPKSVN